MTCSEQIFWRLANRQLGLVALWQLIAAGIDRPEARRLTRRFSRVHRGVYATWELTDLARILAAVLTFGPRASASHSSSLRLFGMRPEPAFEVSIAGRHGRAGRDGIMVHRPCAIEVVRHGAIPTSSPTRALLDVADRLPRPALYRALEQALRAGLPLDDVRIESDRVLGPLLALRHDITGSTRSDSEAAFLLLCHDGDIQLPAVNQQLNGCEADFHWPEHRLVVEVDGFLHHSEKREFETDRERGLHHRIAGYEVVRVSADQVWDRSAMVTYALIAARPALLQRRSRPKHADQSRPASVATLTSGSRT